MHVGRAQGQCQKAAVQGQDRRVLTLCGIIFYEMWQFNVGLYFGCKDGNAVSLADAVQAFLQANLAVA